MSFVSDASYTEFLNDRLRAFEDVTAKRLVVEKLDFWRQQYCLYRQAERAVPLLNELRKQPFAIYVDDALSFHNAASLLKGSSQQALATFQGFVVDDDFLATQNVQVLHPYRVCPRSRAESIDGVVFSMSGRIPAGCEGRYVANDYREKFIDLDRFADIQAQRERFKPNSVVLYPLYREIHTVSIMAGVVRRQNPQLRSISLSPKPLIHQNCDSMLVEPFFYLWPLLFDLLEPDLVHLNVGWGIQALPFSPFVPDRQRTVVDFYEVLSFLPDVYFEKTHSSAEQVRLAEAHFVKNYSHIMHLCSDEISTRLAEKHGSQASITSVTEYMEEPTYNAPPRGDGELRIVYGGCMLSSTNPDDLHYKAFAKIVPYFTQENLQLYIYNSPYVHGLKENEPLKQVIHDLGLTNIHACKPLELDEFVKAISGYDFGATFIRPKDMDGQDYNYFMATKLQTYLRAGLPILIDADNHYMAGLVEKYKIGVVLADDDYENLPAILNRVDVSALKANVVKCRDEFSIEKGGRKVLQMYHEILKSGDQKQAVSVGDSAPARLPKGSGSDPAFGEWIASMAQAENRLYYRDQSTETMASLARYARELQPSVVVEMGTLAGLSLRTWIASTQQTKVHAIDLSFRKLHETKALLPLDLSRVTLWEQDILKTDFASLWSERDKVILFVDAHDLPNVPIMDYVLTTALPSLPEGSIVVVDDLWFSEERLTTDNARAFLENRVVGEIDELQCFEGHYAPYHKGGSFMGFAEVGPLLRFVNRHGIELRHNEGSKHVYFMWQKGLLAPKGQDRADYASEWGHVLHNPLTYVPASSQPANRMKQLADDYQQGRLRDVVESFSRLLRQSPHDQGLAHGLAVCMARVGLLSEARDILSRHAPNCNHPRTRRLFDDLVLRVGSGQSGQVEVPKQETSEKPPEAGVTIFAMPKPFDGHLETIQRNAIRSWTRLDPVPEIILFGEEAGTREMAAEVGALHIPNVECNECGTPLVNRLFEVAQQHASHRIVAYVNADMILFQNFMEGVNKVQAGLAKFLLVGQRYDLVVLDEIDFGRPDWKSVLQRDMQDHAMLHAECGLDYFVFPKGLYSRIPPFAIGRTAWDNWLVMEPHRLGVPVVDGTEFITAVHQEHDYGHVAGGRQEAWAGVEAVRNRKLAGGTDNSGRTSGATRILHRDGTLVVTSSREPWYLTLAYRVQRSEWLIKQADRLIAAGRRELAACRWEETLILLEVLLAFKRSGHIRMESIDLDELNRRYLSIGSQLAQCYVAMGLPDRAVTTYARLLHDRHVQISEIQRQEMRRRQSELARKASAPQGPAGPLAVPERSDARGETPREDAAREVAAEHKAFVPSLKAGMPSRGDNQSPRSPGLDNLERTYRAMANGTRGKYAMAVRLADLFRRAGLLEKSRVLKREAEALKDIRRHGDALSQVTEPRGIAGVSRASLENQPEITIVTPCHNGAGHLVECLDSILKQTMNRWQLFVIDDGSTDGTRQIIEEYAARDARIKPFYFDHSAGPYVRRNSAIGKAATPFVVIQDADDIMCPDKLRCLHEAMTHDDRLGVVGSFYRSFLDTFRSMEQTESVRLATEHEQIMEAYRTRLIWDYAWHGSAIIRRWLFDEIGLYDENPFGADSFWLAKAAEYAHHTGRIRLANTPEFLTLRRMHTDSQTGSLPPFDPRGRRVYYWKYCVSQLRGAVQRAAQDSQLDFGRALRECTCSDFLERFKSEIPRWESQPLDHRAIDCSLQNAMVLFQHRRYVSCVRILRGLERMAPSLPGRVRHFDLFAAMACHGLGFGEECRSYLQREMAQHNNPIARQFGEACLGCETPIDVQQWFAGHGEAVVLRRPEADAPDPASATPTIRDDVSGTPPKVSVVTACRNAESFLVECLDSILAQTFGAWELFLIDDGSTDGTWRIIEDYARRDKRIIPYHFDDNAGPYMRRNFAIERARTEFIVIQDADDIMCPTKLEILYNEITSDDSLALVGSNCRSFLEDYRGPEYAECSRLPLSHEKIIECFSAWRHAMSHGSAIIRKALFSEIGLYDENPFASDSLWSAKLALYAEAGRSIRVRNVPEYLTLIRMHATNHTRLLSTLDPRNRRTRYRLYGECKLRRLRDRIASTPGLDVGQELRQCRCSDFLTRFKAQIIAWESGPLDSRVIPEYLREAVVLFNDGYYISCVNMLNGVEAFDPMVTQRVVGYDLLRGMGYYAVQMKERCIMCLDREIQQHSNAGAVRLKEDVFASDWSLDVQQWCAEHAAQYNLGLAESDNPMVSPMGSPS